MVWQFILSNYQKVNFNECQRVLKEVKRIIEDLDAELNLLDIKTKKLLIFMVMKML